MSRVNSRVMVRVAAEVAFFTTFPVVEVFDFFFFLPVTLSETAVPTIVASVAVMAVMMAFSTLEKNPGFVLFFFSSFSFSASSFALASSAAWASFSAVRIS